MPNAECRLPNDENAECQVPNAELKFNRRSVLDIPHLPHSAIGVRQSAL
jgi:hypothetical protein